MNTEYYKEYTPPTIPMVEWSDTQLNDEVQWLGMHMIEINPIGERREQISKRLAHATMEQMIRYNASHV